MTIPTPSIVETPTTPRDGYASQRILVCDDEELIRWSLSEHLRSEGYTVVTASNGEECLASAMEQLPDAIVLDLKMPKMHGLTCLRKMREADIRVPVIVITAHGAVESAIEATRLGAAAYLPKPFDLREVTLSLEHVLEATRLVDEIQYLRQQRRVGYGRIIGRSSAMERVFDTLRKLEAVDAPTVLIMGESGTGKDLVAQAIHSQGPRSDAPFVEIDCASLPEQLIESQLFGHERGAFTDARQMKRGLFEVARKGTVFLDEIGEMSPGTQAKLLRALENRRFKRVGGLIDLPLDAGIIAATNRDIAKEVERGRFRQDLYYRLAIVPIMIPPLRDRPTDVPLLVASMINHFNQRIASRISSVEADAMNAMQRYAWPGNVRELRNVIERILILNRDAERLTSVHLPSEVRYAQSTQAGVPAEFALPPDGVDLEAVEKSLLRQALERTRWNQSAAARLLGITRYALRYRMEKFSLTPGGEA